MPGQVPVLGVGYDDLVHLIGRSIPRDELIARVPMMGGAYDGEKEGQLLFEFFPNRPDLLTVEGLARACRAFFDVEPGLKRYAMDASGDTVTVDPSVTRVRPVIGFARVERLDLTDALLAELIDVQERLTTGPGRKRKKVAIGIHDAARVKGPFRYTTVGLDEHAFVPLQMDRPLTPRQIFEQHDKGRIYGPLLAGHSRVPLIVDREDQVLSLPPVINGQLTALTTQTQDVIVDVTGTDERSTLGILSIVVTSLAERGGRIKSVQLLEGKAAKPSRVSPDLSPQQSKLSYARIRQLLGLEVGPREALTYLGRLGHHFEPTSASGGTVSSPAWRMDLLHMDDLVEDVGIGYGFEKFEARLPAVAQFGGIHERARKARRVRTLLVGLGVTEDVTLTITNKQDALFRTGAPDRALVEVANPVTMEQSVLRPHLYTSLLGLLRSNKHRELPQSVFEVGLVVPGHRDDGANELRVAALRMAPRATFAECKGIVETFLRDAQRPATLEAGFAPGFIPGRCARLVHEGTAVGFFGELHPETIQAFELGAPIFGFEVAL